MKSWDPMRNFPELEGMAEPEAKALIRSTQKRILREPKILIGMTAVGLTVGLVLAMVFSIGGFVMGAAVGLAIVIYMILVIKPRMKAAFREMGYPKQQAMG